MIDNRVLSPILRRGHDGYLMFWCPACNVAHALRVGGDQGHRWGWNGHTTKPTFSPSIMVRFHQDDPATEHRCHSFVKDGRIEFMDDSTHKLAGQTVDLPVWGGD